MNMSYAYNGAMDVFPRMIAFAVAIVCYLMVFGVGILLYAVQSYGLQTIAKRRGLKKPWLAWIPVANLYLLGSLSDQYQYVSKGRIRNRRKVMLGLCIAIAVLAIGAVVCYALTVVNTISGVFNAAADHRGMITSLLSALGVVGIMELVSIVLAVFQYVCLYDVYRSCEPKSSIAYLLLSIVFPVSMPVFIFLCRNDDKGMPPRRTVCVEE